MQSRAARQYLSACAGRAAYQRTNRRAFAASGDSAKNGAEQRAASHKLPRSLVRAKALTSAYICENLAVQDVAATRNVHRTKINRYLTVAHAVNDQMR